MRRTTWLVAIGAALAVVAGQAIAQASHENSQQQKMTTCNADAKAKGLKGADRKTFMKSCLSDKTAAATSGAAGTTGNSQQEKMKTCNADAKTQSLSGDARKSFMQTCLSAAAPKLNSQQQKMKQCNADAKTRKLTGMDRKTFMSTCLKG